MCELEGRRQSAERAAQARAPGHGEQVEGDQGHEHGVDLPVLHSLGDGLQRHDGGQGEPGGRARRRVPRGAEAARQRPQGRRRAQGRGRHEQHLGGAVGPPGQGGQRQRGEGRVGEGPQVLGGVGVPAVEAAARVPLGDGVVVDLGVEFE